MGFHGFGSIGKCNEKGHGWKFISTFNTCGNSFDVLRKWNVDDLDVGVRKGIGEKRTACRSGEDDDGDSPVRRRRARSMNGIIWPLDMKGNRTTRG